MKKKLLLFAKASFAVAMSISLSVLSSCSDDDNNPDNPKNYDDTEVVSASEANFAFDASGIWRDNAVNGFVEIDDYEFFHSAEDMDGYMYITGYTPSRSTDTGKYNDMSAHPYNCISGGGPDGAGTPYLVANWSSWSESDGTFNTRTTRIYNGDGQPFMPQSVMVNNNTYAYYSMLDGNAYARKFEKGDWFKLIAHGVCTDGTEVTTEFYLANCTEDDASAGIVNDWKPFDLTPLGIVTGLYFTMESSDSGQFGMNTPAYFCIDRLIVKE